ncbi:hypothetical protein [Salibacter halophilus]|uniref:Uncharacterized protein n=1 Tax=Salibacter halophilus TaxID=1803916 RepID=A0A6N6MCI6_9FLAO|nr:hypothetical protein [Salibacter halophilus]KAB1066267.1 hypothetical protein F3059_01970 [Salibacter halophilus]
MKPALVNKEGDVVSEWLCIKDTFKVVHTLSENRGVIRLKVNGDNKRELASYLFSDEETPLNEQTIGVDVSVEKKSCEIEEVEVSIDRKSMKSLGLADTVETANNAISQMDVLGYEKRYGDTIIFYDWVCISDTFKVYLSKSSIFLTLNGEVEEEWEPMNNDNCKPGEFEKFYISKLSCNPDSVRVVKECSGDFKN